MKYKKKAQLEQLQGLVITLVVIGMVLVIGLLIFAQTKEQVVTLISSATATNETVEWINTTAKALAHSPGSVTLSCSVVYNDSERTEEIDSGNYTCGTDGITVTEADPAVTDFETELLVTYTYKTADYAYNATSDVQNATGSIPGWLPIIVVVIIGALLIGLVSFLRGQAG